MYLYIKKMNIWILSYCKGLFSTFSSQDKPIDIMFLFVDHYELAGKPERLDAWLNVYPALAKKHLDFDGGYPKHSFFYALDLIDENELELLKPIMDQKMGEVELHWHHDHDTSESFVEKLHDGMRVFHKYGYMLPYKEDQMACFGFIHGNWSLDNSRGEEFCGVDNEIQILAKEGCYGDFTFPAMFTDAQPSKVNEIYYAIDDGEAKSYETGRTAEVGVTSKDNEFLIFQGPLTINWLDWRHKWHPTIEDGDINEHPTQGDPARIDAWIRQGIHVKGRPEWQFVKVFCHGAQDHKSVLGEATDKMFQYLGDKYNDGKKYRLHYVSSREAYNILKAAEAGKEGNPNEFRDYIIPPPNERLPSKLLEG